MTRILFVGHSPLQGGAEICLDTTLRHLDRDRHQAYAVFPWDGVMSQSARDLGIPVELVPLNWWSHWPPSAWYYKCLMLGVGPNVCRLRSLIRRHRIDLVYTNTLCIFESALAAALANVPHVWHVHEVLRPGTPAPGVLPIWLNKRLINGLSDRVVFESHAARRAFEGEQPSARSRVVHNSVRFGDGPAETDAAAAKGRLGFGPGDIIIGFVGQFIERKNPALLVRALARLRHLPEVKAVFVGEGPLRDEIADLASRFGLADRCRLMEFQSDVRPVLQALDVLVLPSREESFGLVLVEAGAFGKPVVATRVEGPSEIVADGETGFLVEPADDAGLAGRLDLLCRDGERRRRMGEAGRRRVHQLFSPVDNTRRVEKILDEVLNEQAAVRAGRRAWRTRAAC